MISIKVDHPDTHNYLFECPGNFIVIYHLFCLEDILFAVL